MNSNKIEIKPELEQNGRLAFNLYMDGHPTGKMETGLAGNILTVFHTEVLPEAEGKGFAKQLLEAMVSYARYNKLKVKPLCPYVQMQFKRRPEEYLDLQVEPQE